jgi:methyl-accepting chemotaxis protein
MVGLLRIIKLLAVGDFTNFAHLRTKDAIKPMADTMNTMITTYREKILALQTHTQKLQHLVNQADSADLPAALRQEIKEVDSIISTLNL